MGDIVSAPFILGFNRTGTIATLFLMCRTAEALASLLLPYMALRGCVGSQVLAKVMETLCEGEGGRERRRVCAGTSSVMDTSSSPLVPKAMGTGIYSIAYLIRISSLIWTPRNSTLFKLHAYSLIRNFHRH